MNTEINRRKFMICAALVPAAASATAESANPPPTSHSPNPGPAPKGGIRASGTNIVIRGRGILDGSSYARFKRPTRHMVSLDGCTHVVVEGIILRDGWGWTLVPAACDGVEIANVKICSARCENADGIDIVNSRNVTIRDCFIRTDHACIAPKGMGLSNGQAVENILVKDSVLWTDKAHIWGIGCESQAPAMRNIVSENIDVLHFCDAWFDNENGHGPLAITLQPAEDMLMEDIRFESIRIHGEGQKLLLAPQPEIALRYPRSAPSSHSRDRGAGRGTG